MKIDLKVRFSTLVSLPSPISSGTSTGNRGVQMNPISYIILTAEKNAQKGLDFHQPKFPFTSSAGAFGKPVHIQKQLSKKLPFFNMPLLSAVSTLT